MAKKKIQAEDIKRAAEGKWMDLIFPRFGIDVQWKKKTPCPACGGRDRFRFDDKNGKPVPQTHRNTASKGRGRQLTKH